MTFVRNLLLLAAVIGASLTTLPSLAQTDIPQQLLDRPPIAAPTEKVAVGAIPVVLSESQEADNFASGLLQGLMAGGRTKGVGVVVVKDDHVIVQRNYGAVSADTRFAVGAMAAVFDSLATMQMIERGKLTENQDVAQALGEGGTRGMTVAQVLTRQAGDPQLLARAVQKASGLALYDYAAKEIAAPLGMAATGPRGGGLETTLTDMSHLAIALVNGGAYGNGRILESQTVDLMERNHFAPHPALPGAAYGFVEMFRNGWRALQHDGAVRDFTARMVIVPEAKIAYVVLAEGHPGEQFWRALDNGLFDKLFPPRKPEQNVVAATPAPALAEAQKLAGSYESVRDNRTAPTQLKLGRRLFVRAMADGSLVLTGTENGTLHPAAGGYWDDGNGNLRAAARGNELVLSTGIYAPLPFYKRADVYAFLALLTAAATAAYIFYRRRKVPKTAYPREVLAGAAACILLLLISGLVWLLSPVA